MVPNTTVCVLDIVDGAPTLTHKTRDKNPLAWGRGQCYDNTQKTIRRLLDEYPIDAIAREHAVVNQFGAAVGILGMAGVSELTTYQGGGLAIHELYPSTVKKLVAGKGNATKKEVASAVDEILGAQDWACDDESDAAAIGLAYLAQTGAYKIEKSGDTPDQKGGASIGKKRKKKKNADD